MYFSKTRKKGELEKSYFAVAEMGCMVGMGGQHTVAIQELAKFYGY